MRYFFACILLQLACVTFPCCTADEGMALGFPSEFMHSLGSILEDGFFGGVKWGIAAAVYYIFFRTMAVAIGGVPIAVQSLKDWYAYYVDTYKGLPPRLNIHELQVLVSLLQEAMQEHEGDLIPLLSNQAECGLLYRRTLASVMQHIHDYITIRSTRYTDLYADEEVIFLMGLIAKTLISILDCIECPEFHKEVIATAKTTVVLINKLISLLQGPVLDKDLYNPSMAWFNDQRGQHGR